MHYEINDWQKKIIQKKNNLEFEKCVEEASIYKSAFNKTYRKHIDGFSKEMYNQGVLFFGLTLNFPDLLEGDVKELWSNIHQKIEEFIQVTKNDIELCEFLYLTVEKHGKQEKKGKKKIKEKKISKTLLNFPHIHGVLGVRSLLGENKNLIDQIEKAYFNFYTDIKVDYLSNMKKIFSTWNYIIKENNYKFHRMVSFSKIFEQSYSSIYEHQFLFDLKGFLDLGVLIPEKHKDIKGIGSQIKTKKSIVLYLLNLYLYIEGIFINNNEFYVRIKNSKYSWRSLENVDFLKKNNVAIMEKLITFFPQQLFNLEIDDLLINNFDSVYQSIQEHNNYLPNIEFSDDIVEFSDGLYFLNYDYFLSFKKNKELLEKAKINCFKFFEKSYLWCKINKPSNWLLAIVNNIPNASDLENFCSLLGRYFHSRKMILNDQKKKLCVLSALQILVKLL